MIRYSERIHSRSIEDFHSNSKDSVANNPTTNFSPSISKRSSSKVSRLVSLESSTSNLPLSSSQWVLAATIESLIAQLTSDLNYHRLLNFFLTCWTYISAVHLCHPFIYQLYWTLQPPSSSQVEKARRVVRVQTSVAIRY